MPKFSATRDDYRAALDGLRDDATRGRRDADDIGAAVDAVAAALLTGDGAPLLRPETGAPLRAAAATIARQTWARALGADGRTSFFEAVRTRPCIATAPPRAAPWAAPPCDAPCGVCGCALRDGAPAELVALGGRPYDASEVASILGACVPDPVAVDVRRAHARCARRAVAYHTLYHHRRSAARVLLERWSRVDAARTLARAARLVESHD